MAESEFKSIKGRLNNFEFRELIPHIELEKLFLTEVLVNGTWKKIFTEIFNQNKIAEINCNVCKSNIPLGAFQDHMKNVEHNKALWKVDQFYHPIYTYAKTDGKLANGEFVTESETRRAIAGVNAELGKISQERFSEAKSFANSVKTIDNKLIDTALKTNVKRADQLFVCANLPLEDLLKVEFCEKPNEWKPMLKTTKVPHPNGKYQCVICSKRCTGIITVNAHLSGFTHKTHQIATMGMRVLGNNRLTKNCIYKYDTKYTLTLLKEGKTFLRNMLDEQSVGEVANNGMRNTDSHGCSGEKSAMNKCGKSEEQDNSASVPKIKEEIVSDSEDVIFDHTIKEKCTRKNIVTSEELVPLLSDVVAKKAKDLSTNFTKNGPSIGSSVLTGDKEGLIGVEYVIQFMKSPNDVNPVYECCLCKVTLNESAMQNHLISYNHRINYCELHYPDTIKKYKDRIGHVKYAVFFITMEKILRKLAVEIEDYHGRSVPYTTLTSIFKLNESAVISKLKKCRHASQQKGPSFSNLFSAEEIAKLKTQTYRTPTVSSNNCIRFTKIPDGKLYLDQRSYDIRFWGESLHEKLQSRSKSPNIANSERRGPYKRSHTSSPSRVQSDRRHTSPFEHKTGSNDIWKIYREEVSSAASKVESLYMEYRRNPESHPLYDKEWNKFWKRRKEELVLQGIDHRSFNYQPEWVHFFRQRLEQLFGEDLHKSTITVRNRLNIPLDAEEDSKPASIPHRINEFHYIDKSEFSKKPRYGSENLDSECNLELKKGNTWVQIPAAHATYTETKNNPVIDDKPNIIHVLRMMTALEDYLGSLGSKIMELLSQALVLEKQFHNEPLKLEQSILTAKNCTLLETAVEKLKGIVFAGLLDSNKVQGFNRVIQNTSDLLKHAEKMEWLINDSPDYTEKSGSSNQIQKLIEVMQNKRDKLNSTSQKSLSDTLMELISLQRNVGSDNLGINDFKQFHLNEQPQMHNSLVDRSASSSNINRLKQGNEITSTNQSNQMSISHTNNMNQMDTGNFNYKRNLRPSFGQMDNNIPYMNRPNNGNNINNMFGEGGRGRNNLGNSNFNSNPMAIDKLRVPLGGTVFGNNALSNQSSMSNFNSSNNSWANSYQNSSDTGNAGGNGAGNRARFSNNSNLNTNGNNQYWALQQYSNRRGNGNN